MSCSVELCVNFLMTSVPVLGDAKFNAEHIQTNGRISSKISKFSIIKMYCSI